MLAMSDQRIGQVSKYESLAPWWTGNQLIPALKTYNPLSKLQMVYWVRGGSNKANWESLPIFLCWLQGREIWKKEFMQSTSTGDEAGEKYFYICLYKIHGNFQERRWQVGFEHKMSSWSVGRLAERHLKMAFGKGDGAASNSAEFICSEFNKKEEKEKAKEDTNFVL